MGDTLTAGQKLGQGDSITSNNGAYTLTLQEDGNLVLAARGEAVWASATNGQGGDRAEVQTDVLMLGRTEFARCLPENSSMAYAIMRGLVQRLRHADRKIESLALLDVYGRVARALLEFSVDDGQGGRVIREKISRQDIAKMVGASREMVSRVMKDLEERGYIHTQEDGSITIKDRLHAIG